MLTAAPFSSHPFPSPQHVATRLAGAARLRQNSAMSRSILPLTYTDIELRSYLPSGWGILTGAAGLWDRAAATWKIDVYDSADNVWSLAVASRDAESAGRLPALKQSVDKLYRRALS